MAYLIQEIFWYLATAFVLGALVAWLIFRQRSDARPEESTSAASTPSPATEKKPGTPVETIEGIGEGFGRRLKADGIATTDALLKLCTTDAGVARVCKCVDLDENTVRNWATMADLMRIKGLGGQWAELMWRSGVYSVQDLANREIVELRARMREVNEQEHRVAELPGENRMSRFIAEAAQLKPVLTTRQ